ncbi:MAG TPA: hypothetical protein VLG09_00655 [Candidatus Saccharimonadales bacterium]|nr:hypothetical protein [Candidatus Saccharimonadales bacterium]
MSGSWMGKQTTLDHSGDCVGARIETVSDTNFGMSDESTSYYVWWRLG